MTAANRNPGPRIPHYEPMLTRRDMLTRGGGGFGALALAHLLGESGAMAGVEGEPRTPNATRMPHFPAKAKSVIFLYMEGGPSHIDLFDPKPALQKYAGDPLPPSFGKVVLAMGEGDAPIMPSKRKWKRYGRAGMTISDWLPHTAQMADELAVIRSCVSDGINHAGGMLQMNTGDTAGGRPSLGSWATYGLGTENQDLPAFVVLQDKGAVVGGPRNWSNGFMPAAYQGIRFERGAEPIPNLGNPKNVTDTRQRAKLDFLRQRNEAHAADRPEMSDLDARIRAYELAYRMQAAAPEAVDLNQEPDHIKELYGFDDDHSGPMARNCIMARRLVERGVRFVQVYHGAGSKWDSHSSLESNHSRLCRESDQPVAALLKDLKQRGLLEETLVIWGGEFGRTPISEKGDGRDHNPWGFTMWMAGGGVEGGQVIGETDEIGLRATRDPLHVHDLHATVLHLMGIDHTRLVYVHKGRPERVDANEGHAYTRITGRA